MHYKNGREAKQGDIVVHLNNHYSSVGVLHSLSAASDTCNARLAQTSANDPYITVKDCLHIDDVAAADVPPPAEPPSDVASEAGSSS